VNIGKGLKFVRLAADLQQKEMAERLEISQNYLSLLENNKAEPSVALLRKVAEEFQVPASFLLWEENASTESSDPEINARYEKLRQLIHELQRLRINSKKNEAVASDTPANQNS
jgi:transcriptional regulator with XRE-family HTH domain